MGKKSKERIASRLSWVSQGVSDRTLRQNAAFHEAGHAVVALAADVQIAVITLDDAVIVPGAQRGAGNGFTGYVPPEWFREGFLHKTRPWPLRTTLDQEEENYIFRRIAVAVAGDLAERRLQEKSGGDFRQSGEHERDDIGQASKWARYLADGDMQRAQRILDQAVSKADDVMERLWPQVEKIAQQLLAKRRLSPTDLYAEG